MPLPMAGTTKSPKLLNKEEIEEVSQKLVTAENQWYIRGIITEVEQGEETPKIEKYRKFIHKVFDWNA